jgi:hypothetical protein
MSKSDVRSPSVDRGFCSHGCLRAETRTFSEVNQTEEAGQ